MNTACDNATRMQAISIIHRWLGVIACLAVLMFAGSGILHPVMSRTQPQPAQFMPPRVELTTAPLSLRAVLEKNRIERFASAALVQLPQVAAYRVQIGASAHYFRVDDGEAMVDGEKIHAEFLARHFLGDNTAPVTAIAERKIFDGDYVFVNRLLPAWRIDFARDDGMRVYVDTAGNRLATLTDTKKRIFQIYFRALHDFSFLDKYAALRLAIMLLLLTTTFATAAAGVAMYVRLRRAGRRLKNLPARRWHRRLSLAIAVVTFSFTVSGVWHLLQSRNEAEPIAAPPNEFATDELGDTLAMQAFVLLRANDHICYRYGAMAMRGAGHEHHSDSATGASAPVPPCFDTQTMQPVPDAERQLAVRLARHYARSESEIASIQMIAKFGGEYGFINKRLPVWKVQFESDSTRWYVETVSGALALRADDADAREGWVFSIFHKARFIGDAYKNWRDGLLMAAALGCIIVAILGMILFTQRLRRRRQFH